MKNGKKHSTNGTSNEIVTLNHDGSERYVVRREELVRVLLQSLDNLGYEKTRDMLESESGICMESKDVIRFKKYVGLVFEYQHSKCISRTPHSNTNTGTYEVEIGNDRWRC